MGERVSGWVGGWESFSSFITFGGIRCMENDCVQRCLGRLDEEPTCVAKPPEEDGGEQDQFVFHDPLGR